jgi:hypothetical protein
MKQKRWQCGIRAKREQKGVEQAAHDQQAGPEHLQQPETAKRASSKGSDRAPSMAATLARASASWPSTLAATCIDIRQVKMKQKGWQCEIRAKREQKGVEQAAHDQQAGPEHLQQPGCTIHGMFITEGAAVCSKRQQQARRCWEKQHLLGQPALSNQAQQARANSKSSN